MPKVLDVEYKLFGPGDFYHLLQEADKAGFIPPTIAEVMKARVSIVEKRHTFKQGQKPSDWLRKNLYTCDGIMRWKGYDLTRGIKDSTSIIYEIPVKSWLEGKKNGGESLHLGEKADSWGIGSYMCATNPSKVPTLEVKAYQQRDTFQNLRIGEVSSNGLWIMASHGDKNLLEHYIGAMALEVQRQNYYGISSLMGIDVHDQQFGELSPMIMAAANYCEDANIRTYQIQKRRADKEVYLIALEKRFPEIKFDNKSLKDQKEKAPLIAMINVGFRHLAAQAEISSQKAKNPWEKTGTCWKKTYK